MEQEKKPGQGSSVAGQNPQAQKSPKPTLESARLLRLAERLHLSSETMDKIKDKIFGPQGRDISRIEAKHKAGGSPGPEPKTKTQKVPEHYPKVETIDEREFLAKTPRREEALEDEILLRKKIEASPIFATFKSDAWKLYEKYPRSDVAGRLIELALMYGSAEDLEEVLKQLSRDSIEFFPLLNAQTRASVIVRLWQAKRQSFMDEFYFRKDLILKLVPVERWYVAWSLVSQSKSDQAYRWYKRNEHEIFAMQKQYGSVLQKSESELAYALGAAAFRMADEDAALKLLEMVPKTAPEFSAAVDLLLDVRIERDEKGYSTYELRLSRELDWKARLGLLDTFLSRQQKVEHLAPKDRAALNALLTDPLRWFPETAEAWNLLSQLLLQYSGLEKLLPNLLKTFHDKALEFQIPSLEHSLWSPVLEHDFRNPVKSWYWHSIALVHEYALTLGQEEKKLWEARELYAEAEAHEGKKKALPRSWQEIHRALSQWVSKTERLDDAARKRLLLMTKICGETRDLSEADIREYLRDVTKPGFEVLEAMESLARDRKQDALELTLIHKKATELHFTNKSLGRLFELARNEQKIDLAWRSASLLYIRKSLGPEVERSWAISGEKRRDYPFQSLKDSHLKKIFACFEGIERRLVEAITSVGPLIPELLASLNPHLVPQKRTKPVTRTETEVQDALGQMEWLAEPKKHFSSGPGGLWQTKPPFFSNLTDGKWSVLYVGLSQRLGLNAWDWQLSLLNQQIETLIPKMTRTSDTLQAGKVGRWLRTLSPAQRKSWYELAQISKRIEDEKAQEVLGRFVALLTTSIYEDHIGALSTLERVRAPLRLRWDLEAWIVSDSYGEIRKSLGTQANGRFPEHILRMAIVNPMPVPMSPKGF